MSGNWSATVLSRCIAWVAILAILVLRAPALYAQQENNVYVKFEFAIDTVREDLGKNAARQEDNLCRDVTRALGNPMNAKLKYWMFQPDVVDGEQNHQDKYPRLHVWLDSEGDWQIVTQFQMQPGDEPRSRWPIALFAKGYIAGEGPPTAAKVIQRVREQFTPKTLAFYGEDMRAALCAVPLGHDVVRDPSPKYAILRLPRQQLCPDLAGSEFRIECRLNSDEWVQLHSKGIGQPVRAGAPGPSAPSAPPAASAASELAIRVHHQKLGSDDIAVHTDDELTHLAYGYIYLEQWCAPAAVPPELGDNLDVLALH